MWCIEEYDISKQCLAISLLMSISWRILRNAHMPGISKN